MAPPTLFSPLFEKKKCVGCIKGKGERGLFSGQRDGGLLGRVATRPGQLQSRPFERSDLWLVSFIGSFKRRSYHHQTRDSDERIDNEQSASWRNLISQRSAFPYGGPSSEILCISTKSPLPILCQRNWYKWSPIVWFFLPLSLVDLLQWTDWRTESWLFGEDRAKMLKTSNV